LALAEHVGAEQRRGEGGTGHGEERPGEATAMVMVELEDHLLAAAAFARDEHRRVGRGHLAGQLYRAPERRGGAQERDLVRMNLQLIERIALLARYEIGRAHV